MSRRGFLQSLAALVLLRPGPQHRLEFHRNAFALAMEPLHITPAMAAALKVGCVGLFNPPYRGAGRMHWSAMGLAESIDRQALEAAYLETFA